ncbi:MAG: hypothetical protein CL610_09745 [Anaerolineaceae bacterium]|nr:hypothetical protein [Anaerolineaceae bacterium]
MTELAARLMMYGRDSGTAVPTAIFGTAGTVRHSLQTEIMPVRIGMWPIISASDPEVATGILLSLGYLLQRYQGVRVYYLLAQVEGDPAAFEWTIADSQFDVDDWQLDELDENVAIWGSLDGWSLTLSIENDALTADDNDAEVETLVYEAGSLSELVNKLPQIADDVASKVDATEKRLIAPVAEFEMLEDRKLHAALAEVFRWELQQYLALWQQQDGLAHSEHYERLIETCQAIGNFGAWLAANALARSIRFSEDDVEDFVPQAEEAVEAFNGNQVLPVILAGAFYDQELAQDAYQLLESEIEADQASAITYLAAAELYRRGGMIPEAVDTMQRAIETGQVDAALYRRYAELLVAMEYSGLQAEALILTDPTDDPQEELLQEAVAAYEAALTLEPDSVVLLSQQLTQFMELGETHEAFWEKFARLVRLDESSEYLRVIVDDMESLDGLTPAIDALERAIADYPDRVDLLLDLAVLQIFDENEQVALAVLERARSLTQEDALISDIERLTLMAEYPEFDMKIGEITDILGAGNMIQSEDVEFLESVLERTPGYEEIHVLLARAYLGWEEPASALETLLDGYKHSPHDADLLALLGQVLWESGERDLAFRYLNEGITHNPNHVPLLALAGQYLFEDEQEAAARAYLARAEAIAPRHPVLIQVRQYIGRLLNQ